MVVEKCPDIPVAVVQYTFTHKLYTKQHNETEYTERYIHNNNVVLRLPEGGRRVEDLGMGGRLRENCTKMNLKNRFRGH
jgi:hypothetical protein